MALRVFVDIETLPPEEQLRREVAPDKIRKILRRQARPEDEGADGRGCTEEEFRALALHAEFGRVLSVGVIVEKDGEVVHRGVLGRERQSLKFHLDEARTLRAFWNLLKGFNVGRDLIVAHNGLAFDLPFLEKRSLIHRVRPSVRLSYARYRTRPIYDTMQVWAHWDARQYVSLSMLAETLKIGISKSEGMDGSSVYDRFCEGCHQEIAEYNLRDCELVRAAYYRMEFPEGPEPVD